MKWLILIFGILSNVFASVLVKIAGQKHDLVTSAKEPLQLLSNIPLVSGIALYGIAFILYALALQKFPLSFAHPVLTSGAILGVALFSMLYFNEPFGIIKWIGFVFLILGVFLISL